MPTSRTRLSRSLWVRLTDTTCTPAACSALTVSRPMPAGSTFSAGAPPQSPPGAPGRRPTFARPGDERPTALESQFHGSDTERSACGSLNKSAPGARERGQSRGGARAGDGRIAARCGAIGQRNGRGGAGDLGSGEGFFELPAGDPSRGRETSLESPTSIFSLS